jgi:hypothetical protein
METMSYPYSPLIPFPTQYEESSYLLWSPQVVIPHENGNMSDVDPIPSPDVHQDNEFMDMLIQEASDMFQGDPPDGDVSLNLARLVWFEFPFQVCKFGVCNEL